MTYNKSNKENHVFTTWPQTEIDKVRTQLTPSGHTLIWGHIEHKWHLIKVVISSLLEFDKAKEIAEELTLLLEGTMLTLEKALQIWPGSTQLQKYKVKFNLDGRIEEAFAPSADELMSYAEEKKNPFPLKVIATIETWKLSTVDGRWHKERKISITEDIEKIKGFQERITS